MNRNIACYALIGLLLSLGGCHTMESSSNTMADKSLYERLGGKPALRQWSMILLGVLPLTLASTADSPRPTFLV
jgi:hypothetical protein